MSRQELLSPINDLEFSQSPRIYRYSYFNVCRWWFFKSCAVFHRSTSKERDATDWKGQQEHPFSPRNADSSAKPPTRVEDCLCRMRSVPDSLDSWSGKNTGETGIRVQGFHLHSIQGHASYAWLERPNVGYFLILSGKERNSTSKEYQSFLLSFQQIERWWSQLRSPPIIAPYLMRTFANHSHYLSRYQRSPTSKRQSWSCNLFLCIFSSN